MKYLIIPLLFWMAAFQNATFGQHIITGKTKPVTLNIEPDYEFTLPPNLYVKLNYLDDNKNGILEAEEKSMLNLAITNKGKGQAQGLKVSITSAGDNMGLRVGNEIFIRSIKPGETKEVSIPINASFNVKTAENKLQINVSEHFGYDMDPAMLYITTLEFQKPLARRSLQLRRS